MAERGSHEVVALLLGDTLPPERLGELLRDGRKRRGWKRKHVAAIAHVNANTLRAYEKGEEPVPAEVCARLAEVYGESLTAHVPLRVAPPVEPGGNGDAIGAYVALVRRLRGVRDGDAFPLRANDLAALSAALELDTDTIEQHIVDALGCTRDEARSLHRELLARKVVLPVAGLAAGLIALAGVQAASATTAPSAAPVPSAPAAVAAAPTTEITVAPPTTVVQPVFTPPSTAAPTPETAPAPVAGRTPHIINNVSEAPPAPPVTNAPAATPPSIPEDDSPVGVLPGETPHPPPAP
jgi:transcriptional regulator with XRE-family HTH domain